MHSGSPALDGLGDLGDPLCYVLVQLLLLGLREQPEGPEVIKHHGRSTPSRKGNLSRLTAVSSSPSMASGQAFSSKNAAKELFMKAANSSWCSSRVSAGDRCLGLIGITRGAMIFHMYIIFVSSTPWSRLDRFPCRCAARLRLDPRAWLALSVLWLVGHFCPQHRFTHGRTECSNALAAPACFPSSPWTLT